MEENRQGKGRSKMKLMEVIRQDMKAREVDEKWIVIKRGEGDKLRVIQSYLTWDTVKDKEEKDLDHKYIFSTLIFYRK